MRVATCISAILLCTAKFILTENVSRDIPFAEAALWASNVEDVQACAKGKCDDELKAGVIQAWKYALNNARLALKHSSNKKAAVVYMQAIEELLGNVAKLEAIMEPGEKKFEKKFKKFMKNMVSAFDDDNFKKVLKQSNATMEIPNNDIGLTWQSKSLDLPIYKKEDVKKALSELRFKMSNNIEIPRIGFGTWQTESKQCQDAVKAALKIGYRHIDTAQTYENEADVGKAIKDAIQEGIVKREELFIVTKLSDPGEYSTKKAAKRIQQQIKSLQSDYVDLYMLHGPEGTKKNRAAWKGMMKMQKEGKIKSLGISNFESPKEVKALGQNMEEKPIYIQNKFSVYSPGGQSVEQDSMLKKAGSIKMAFVGYSVNNPWPFVLTPMQDPHVVAIAKRYGRTPAQILNRWALQLNVIIIPKSSSAARIEENARVVEFALDESDMRLLNGLSTLYQSSTEQRPSFTQDIYGLFEGDSQDQNEEDMPRDEL